MRNIGVSILGLIIITGIFIVWNFNSTEKPEASVFYVPNAGDGTISVVDPFKEETIETISLGTSQASHGIALSKDGKKIFTGTGFDGKSLVVIDAETKEVEKEIPFDAGVHGIDISNDGQFLYVTLMNGLGSGEGTVAIFTVDKMEKIAEVKTGGGPAHIAVKPDGSQVWIANVNGDTIAVMDSKENQIIKTIDVGKVPNEVALSPDGKLAFVANVESGVVSVIDTNQMEIIKSIKAGDAPHGVTVSPDGTEAWVANNDSNDVSVIDIDTFEVKATIPTGSYANHVAFSHDGEWAYVTNRDSNDVVKINAVDKEVTGRIPVGAGPHEITLEDYYNQPK